LKELSRHAARCWLIDSLFGFEGLGRIYFEHFVGMRKVDVWLEKDDRLSRALRSNPFARLVATV
jgi:hypothetical protein